MTPAAIELRGISKSFGTLVANNSIDLTIARGEIRAIVGENGAGKSTLMNILYGLQQPDAGEIRIFGQPVQFYSALDAIKAGLGMVHQHFMLFPSLSVYENVVFGAEPGKAGCFDRRTAINQVTALSEQFGLQLDVQARVQDLSLSLKQRVEIVKDALPAGIDLDF